MIIPTEEQFEAAEAIDNIKSIREVAQYIAERDERIIKTIRAAMVRLEEAEKLIAVLKKTPYTLSEPNGAETLASWEKYNGR